ncbi:Wzz/FepE/Etk N-terminal domain-containing protein [Gilvibacter sp.]|uniref:Wzz/FepE/Etk N-terminal domain-containing protein n=1 Tax=Gilvibacter sp. TaxID=2729997 RepID=UPI0035BE1AB8
MINNDQIIQTFWSKRFFILKVLFIFLLLGLVVALFTPKKYISKTVILPQVSSPQGLGKKLGGFARLVGIDIGGENKNEIYPTLYPVVAKSNPFRRQILNTSVNKGSGDSETIKNYLNNARLKGPGDYAKEYTLGLPSKIVGLFKSEDGNVSIQADSSLFSYSKDEKKYFDYLEENVTVAFNEVEGYIEIQAIMPDALPAAQLTKNVQELLQEYIIELNISKAKDELAYLEKRVQEADSVYKETRDRFGSFRDRNKNYISSVTENRYEVLRTENELAYNVYSQLASQLESAKLQVKRDTPIFTVLKPVTVPLEPAGPNKALIIFIYLFLGFLFSSAVIISKLYWPEIKARYLSSPKS